MYQNPLVSCDLSALESAAVRSSSLHVLLLAAIARRNAEQLSKVGA